MRLEENEYIESTQSAMHVYVFITFDGDLHILYSVWKQ